jgi:hypothetical protein
MKGTLMPEKLIGKTVQIIGLLSTWYGLSLVVEGALLCIV